MNGPPGLDLGQLSAYLRSAPATNEVDHGPWFERFAAGELSAELLAGGRSNLTYLVSDGLTRVVLRRPPLGHVLATAHDMSREFRVIAALGPTAVPVPQALLLCEDAAVIGAPFYLMEHVDGLVLRNADDLRVLDGDQQVTLGYRLVDVLADLHGLAPGDVGLGDLGRADGYLARQVTRWGKQLDSSRSRVVPGIDELRAELATGAPESTRAGIVHGDFRLDNTMVSRTQPTRVVAVLDWEMATLGDPLADLGLLLVYRHGIRSAGVLADAMSDDGFPHGRDLVARYAERTHTDVGHLSWYVGLAFFKLAVILEGIHFRHVAGQTVGGGFEHIGDLVAPLVAGGRAALKNQTAWEA